MCSTAMRSLPPTRTMSHREPPSPNRHCVWISCKDAFCVADGSVRETSRQYSLHKLLVHLRVVLQQVLHHSSERLIVCHARCVRCVLPSILVSGVGGNLRRDVVANSLRDPVAIGEKRSELIIERLKDVAQAIQLGFRLMTTGLGRDRFDFSALVSKRNL